VWIRIIEAIDGLPKGDVKKLTGKSGYRLRVGQYRVIFEMNYDTNIIDIITIASRGQICK